MSNNLTPQNFVGKRWIVWILMCVLEYGFEN